MFLSSRNLEILLTKIDENLCLDLYLYGLLDCFIRFQYSFYCLVEIFLSRHEVYGYTLLHNFTISNVNVHIFYRLNCKCIIKNKEATRSWILRIFFYLQTRIIFLNKNNGTKYLFT